MEDHLSYRLRISALWILQMVAFFAYRTIAVGEGVTEVSVLSNSELATVLLVMMVFVFLSLALANLRFNRLMNIIAGTVFLVVQLIMLVDGLTAYPGQSFNLMTGASAVFMGSVVWLAYRWLRMPAKNAETSMERA